MNGTYQEDNSIKQSAIGTPQTRTPPESNNDQGTADASRLFGHPIGQGHQTGGLPLSPLQAGNSSNVTNGPIIPQISSNEVRKKMGTSFPHSKEATHFTTISKEGNVVPTGIASKSFKTGTPVQTPITVPHSTKSGGPMNMQTVSSDRPETGGSKNTMTGTAHPAKIGVPLHPQRTNVVSAKINGATDVHGAFSSSALSQGVKAPVTAFSYAKHTGVAAPVSQSAKTDGLVNVDISSVPGVKANVPVTSPSPLHAVHSPSGPVTQTVAQPNTQAQNPTVTKAVGSAKNQTPHPAVVKENLFTNPQKANPHTQMSPSSSSTAFPPSVKSKGDNISMQGKGVSQISPSSSSTAFPPSVKSKGENIQGKGVSQISPSSSSTAFPPSVKSKGDNIQGKGVSQISPSSSSTAFPPSVKSKSATPNIAGSNPYDQSKGNGHIVSPYDNGIQSVFPHTAPQAPPGIIPQNNGSNGIPMMGIGTKENGHLPGTHITPQSKATHGIIQNNGSNGIPMVGIGTKENVQLPGTHIISPPGIIPQNNGSNGIPMVGIGAKENIQLPGTHIISPPSDTFGSSVVSSKGHKGMGLVDNGVHINSHLPISSSSPNSQPQLQEGQYSNTPNSAIDSTKPSKSGKIDFSGISLNNTASPLSRTVSHINTASPLSRTASPTSLLQKSPTILVGKGTLVLPGQGSGLIPPQQRITTHSGTSLSSQEIQFRHPSLQSSQSITHSRHFPTPDSQSLQSHLTEHSTTLHITNDPLHRTMTHNSEYSGIDQSHTIHTNIHQRPQSVQSTPFTTTTEHHKQMKFRLTPDISNNSIDHYQDGEYTYPIDYHDTTTNYSITTNIIEQNGQISNISEDPVINTGECLNPLLKGSSKGAIQTVYHKSDINNEDGASSMIPQSSSGEKNVSGQPSPMIPLISKSISPVLQSGFEGASSLLVNSNGVSEPHVSSNIKSVVSPVSSTLKSPIISGKQTNTLQPKKLETSPITISSPKSKFPKNNIFSQTLPESDSLRPKWGLNESQSPMSPAKSPSVSIASSKRTGGQFAISRKTSNSSWNRHQLETFSRRKSSRSYGRYSSNKQSMLDDVQRLEEIGGRISEHNKNLDREVTKARKFQHQRSGSTHNRSSKKSFRTEDGSYETDSSDVSEIARFSRDQNSIQHKKSFERFPSFKQRSTLCSDYSDCSNVTDFQSGYNVWEDFVRPVFVRCPAFKHMTNRVTFPMGYILQPMAPLLEGQIEIPTIAVEHTGIPRCDHCRGYVNPWVTWVENGKMWVCNLCQKKTEVAIDYYAPLNYDYQRLDYNERPELNYSTYEYVYPRDETDTRKDIPTYLFVIDVSQKAIQSGMIEAIFGGILDALTSRFLPRSQRRLQIGFITYDGHVHFWDFSSCTKPEGKPRMVVMHDIDDPFVPLNEMFVNVYQCRRQLFPWFENFAEMIPGKSQASYGSCMGVAIDLAIQVLEETGGKLLICTSQVATVGKFSIDAPKDKARRDRDVQGAEPHTLFKPFHQGFRILAKNMVKKGITCDLFVISQQYFDIATIGELATLTGGDIHIYQKLQDRSVDVLAGDVASKLTRTNAWNCYFRMRVNKGWKLHKYYGHFDRSFGDLIKLQNMHEFFSFGVAVTPNDDTQIDGPAYIQCALLYTCNEGIRRVRLHNWRCPSTTKIEEMIECIDSEALITMATHIAVEKSLNGSLMDGIVYLEYLAQEAISIQIKSREALQLLPVDLLGMLKSIAFRERFGNIDFRFYQWCRLTSGSIQLVSTYYYPRLVSIHDLSDKILDIDEYERPSLPSMLNLSHDTLKSHGIYILEDGETMFVWIGCNVEPELLQEIFGTSDTDKIDPETFDEMWEEDSDVSGYLEKIIGLVSIIKEERMPTILYTILVREGDDLERYFHQYLVEDQTEGLQCSYQEFMKIMVRKELPPRRRSTLDIHDESIIRPLFNHRESHTSI